jgi:hypothetical protein
VIVGLQVFVRERAVEAGGVGKRDRDKERQKGGSGRDRYGLGGRWRRRRDKKEREQESASNFSKVLGGDITVHACVHLALAAHFFCRSLPPCPLTSSPFLPRFPTGILLLILLRLNFCLFRVVCKELPVCVVDPFN